MKWERARTDEQKEVRIAEIVAATERLYEKYSFKEITFVLIAEEAKFTRSNLYKYFSSKEEVFLEFVKHDIKQYIKVLEKNFRFKKKYTIDEFVKIWVNSLIMNKRLLDLFGILYTSLEKNCSFESLTNFKYSLKDDIEDLVKLLCRIFPELTPEKAGEFIYLQNSAAVGLYQMTNNSETQQKVLENPDFKEFNVDFKILFTEAVEHITRGILK